ncbi:host nuclease inhibitor GamL [Pantoea sp. ME81]|uniref:host nuclease inhibitor GamL n=1 Tax=Pantoea sp. ME81 TaxID=2743935 RepID=UPI0015F5690E|nr:host nuclease inhibitor GamL [Pantoea sp. ME81]
MMRFLQQERHKESLDTAEQAAIEKEKWIDEEAARLLSHFPDRLYEFRYWRLHPEVLKCCRNIHADDPYLTFIAHLAYLQARDNYDLQVVLGWEDPSR